MADDPATQAARTLTATANNIRAAHRTAPNAAGLIAKNVFLDEAKTATGGSGRLRNVGKSGAELGVGYEVTVNADGARVILRARGPWGIVEKGHKAYEIRPKRRGGKRALSFEGKAFAVVHRSAKSSAKEPWSKGSDKVPDKVSQGLALRYARAATSAW